MIPRSQHFGDHTPFPFSRSGIVGIFKQAVLKRFVITTRSRAHYAGKQPNASVEQHQRAHLSARQYDVAHTDLFDLRTGVEQALVKAFKPSAQDDRARSSRKGADARLRDGRTARRHRQDG